MPCLSLRTSAAASLRTIALAIVAAAAPVLAQSGTPATMTPMRDPDPRLASIHEKMKGTLHPGAAALSPDGKLLAWTLGRGEQTELHLTDLAATQETSKDLLITPSSSGACSNSAPTWAPDSSTLAYTSTCTASGGSSKPAEDAQPQLFLYTRATKASRQLTHLAGIFEEAQWSPNGHTLAFLFVEHASRSAGALAAMKPWSGVIGEDGIEIQRVFAVDVQTGHESWLTPATLHAFEFGWAPDSRSIVFVGSAPPGENTWWIAKLYTQGLVVDGSGQIPNHPADGSAAIPRVIFDPNTTSSSLHGLQIAVPRWSPDGKHIAFIGGLMSDQGSTGGDIWTISADGGEPTDVTPEIDGTPTYLAWLTPAILGFAEDRRGHSLLVGWNVEKKAAVKGDFVDLGETDITGGPIKMAISLANTGAMAFVESGHNQAPEIFAGPIESLKQITHLNDKLKPLARTESIEWTNEGFHVQGWLTYPLDYDPAKKYPLLVNVHGGPSATASARWNHALWSQLGYFEFQPNPRGSFGQGEKFTAANIKDFGYGDLRDILAGMDAVEKKVSVDKTREALGGWSYGGFMTMFAVTQTHRFRAAFAGAGISDWKSYYGENSIDQWMLPFFGKTVYDDPAVYARSSAIDYIKNVQTPTLVVVGDRDGECPAPQSFEFWHALRAQGVNTQLVVYPNEGHGFSDPAHIRDLEARQVAWFTQQMPAQTQSQTPTQTPTPGSAPTSAQ